MRVTKPHSNCFAQSVGRIDEILDWNRGFKISKAISTDSIANTSSLILENFGSKQDATPIRVRRVKAFIGAQLNNPSDERPGHRTYLARLEQRAQRVGKGPGSGASSSTEEQDEEDSDRAGTKSPGHRSAAAAPPHAGAHPPGGCLPRGRRWLVGPLSLFSARTWLSSSRRKRSPAQTARRLVLSHLAGCAPTSALGAETKKASHYFNFCVY